MYKTYTGLVGLLIINFVEAITHANCRLSLVNGTIIETRCSCPVGMIPHGSYCIQLSNQCPHGYFDIFENKCKCFKYNDEDNIDAGCENLCPDGCSNGVCVGPGLCYCYGGYTKSAVTNKCEPFCEKGCENSYCSLPNVCNWYIGYSSSKVANKCEPVCEKQCQNSYCGLTNWCICNTGYSRVDNYKCAPVCSKGCNNGVCFAPERCACNIGYRSSESNGCEPVCKHGCGDYSKCVAPDKCRYTNFVDNDDSDIGNDHIIDSSGFGSGDGYDDIVNSGFGST